MKTKLLGSAAAFIVATAFGAASAEATTFGYTGSVQTFDVTQTAEYQTVAAGAQGGTDSYSFYTFAGGYGAVLTGDVELTSGTVLNIVVGGQGGSYSTEYGCACGGGGGGSGLNCDPPGGMICADAALPAASAAATTQTKSDIRFMEEMS